MHDSTVVDMKLNKLATFIELDEDRERLSDLIKINEFEGTPIACILDLKDDGTICYHFESYTHRSIFEGWNRECRKKVTGVD